MNVWERSGSPHPWSPAENRPTTPWEARMDWLMEHQLTALKYEARKKLYDEVQKLVAENLPLIPLASGNILVGGKDALGNFRPAILDPYTLWNVEELYLRPRGQKGGKSTP